MEDHCRAIDLIIRNGRVGEVYNVGGHNEKTNLEVVQLIIAALGKGEIKFVRDRAGHDRRYAIDPTKIHNELGWLPQTKFEDGIPILAPGERITRDILDYIRYAKEKNCMLLGTEDPEVNSLQVIRGVISPE